MADIVIWTILILLQRISKNITDIYNYVIEQKQKYERMYEKNKCEDYLDKIRNTDIFDKSVTAHS